MKVIDAAEFPPLPPIFSILVGETIYNLRAALDYLVYELAFLDVGQIQKGTQFPIENWPPDKRLLNAFKKSWAPKGKHRYLCGINPEHKAPIRRLQPFAGCTWTETLRDLSNPDKHKTLTKTQVTDTAVEMVTVDLTGQAIRLFPEYTVKMHSDFSPNILFDNGKRVMETLQELQRQVTAVLDMFRPAF